MIFNVGLGAIAPKKTEKANAIGGSFVAPKKVDFFYTSRGFCGYIPKRVVYFYYFIIKSMYTIFQ